MGDIAGSQCITSYSACVHIYTQILHKMLQRVDSDFMGGLKTPGGYIMPCNTAQRDSRRKARVWDTHLITADLYRLHYIIMVFLLMHI